MAVSESDQHRCLGGIGGALFYSSESAVYNADLQDAELASVENNPDAIKLYDVAVKYVQVSI